jgi:hypothetical protein
MRNEDLLNKWKPVLEHSALPEIGNSHKTAVTAQILENTETAIREGQSYGAGAQLLGEAAPATNTADVANYDPVLINLVRRAMPNLIAYDIVGVQPMTGPTGLIFAMRAVQGAGTQANTGNTEALFNEADTSFSGTGTHDGGAGEGTGAAVADAGYGTGMATTAAEALDENTFAEMSFQIDKVTVSAKSRALKAEYSTELAQDLKAIHGLDAEQELSNMLSAELLAEINREVVRTVYTTATEGAQGEVATDGTFNLDVDANGRWSVEKFKGLMFQIEKEANAIAKATRRGKGNIIICSSDVASALQMAGVLDYAPALNSNNLNPDDTGNTFVGVLNGRYKVYIDPYSVANYLVVGYKGANAFDAGIFYCPYVPLQMVRAVGENTFQSKIGFKTRYGMVANPFANGTSVKGNLAADGSTGGFTAGNDVGSVSSNVYYRRVLVTNLL